MHTAKAGAKVNQTGKPPHPQGGVAGGEGEMKLKRCMCGSEVF